MKKGISLIVLVITIILLSVLAGVVVFKTTPILTNVDKTKLQTDISQLEALMNTYKIRKNGNIDFPTVQFSTAGLTSAELAQLEGETITGNRITLYVIDLKEIDAEAVNYGNLKLGAKDRYLYSLATGRVYYEQGLDIDGEIYYHVSY